MELEDHAGREVELEGLVGKEQGQKNLVGKKQGEVVQASRTENHSSLDYTYLNLYINFQRRKETWDFSGLPFC